MPSTRKPARAPRDAKSKAGKPSGKGSGPRARRTASPSREAGRAPAPDAARAAEAAVTAEAPAKGVAAPAGRPARRAKPAAGKTITVLQVRSGIQCPIRQKRILRSLGLRHPHHKVIRPDNPAVRGMVNAIRHLVQIVEA